jgi:hypothetical protein
VNSQFYCRLSVSLNKLGLQQHQLTEEGLWQDVLLALLADDTSPGASAHHADCRTVAPRSILFNEWILGSFTVKGSDS